MTVADGFPKLDKSTRPWECARGVETCTRTSPCPSCRSKRNRKKGKRGQGVNRRALETLFGVVAKWRGKLANEETADHLPVRYENKAGKAGGANTIARYYLLAESQSEAARAIGDRRPFIATFSPDGMLESDGLVVVRMSNLEQLLEAFIEAHA
jgi:hypothetical protein